MELRPRPSFASLHLAGVVGAQAVSTATGFLVVRNGTTYLITNWHVVTGRHPFTNVSEKTPPDAISVTHLIEAKDVPEGISLRWSPTVYPLYDDEAMARFLVHPTFGHVVDVVALPLEIPDGVIVVDLASDVDLAAPGFPALHMAGRLSIVGFPFGMTAGGAIPIWTAGFIATDPAQPFGGFQEVGPALPCFLIDSRTREGQSGSPVVFYEGGPTYGNNAGAMVLTQAGSETMFLIGIYSGRISGDSDVGFAWHVRVINEIIDGGQRG